MKILFFGDSITEAGRDLSSSESLGNGYVKIAAGKLRLLYPDKELTILNCGVGGDTTFELLKRIKQDVLSENPDCVILQIGVNDVWKHFTTGDGTSAEDFKSNYSKLVAQLQKSGCKLILMQAFAFNMGDKARFRNYINLFNEIIREIAQEKKLPVIPMDEIFSGVTLDIKPAQFSVDGVHLTHRGCRYVADAVIRELKRSVL